MVERSLHGNHRSLVVQVIADFTLVEKDDERVSVVQLLVTEIV